MADIIDLTEKRERKVIEERQQAILSGGADAYLAYTQAAVEASTLNLEIIDGFREMLAQYAQVLRETVPHLPTELRAKVETLLS